MEDNAIELFMYRCTVEPLNKGHLGAVILSFERGLSFKRGSSS